MRPSANPTPPNPSSSATITPLALPLQGTPGDVEQLERLERVLAVRDDVVEQRGGVVHVEQEMTDAEPAQLTHVGQQSTQLVEYLAAGPVDHRVVGAVARLARERELDLLEQRHRVVVEELEEARYHLPISDQ